MPLRLIVIDTVTLAMTQVNVHENPLMVEMGERESDAEIDLSDSDEEDSVNPVVQEKRDQKRGHMQADVWLRAHVACFDSFDLDGDGALSVGELELAFKQLGLAPSPEDLRDLLLQYDVDHDGELSKEEFLTMVSSDSCGPHFLSSRGDAQTFPKSEGEPDRICGIRAPVQLEEYTKAHLHEFSSHDWSDADYGCLRIDCVKWGHRDIRLDRKEAVITGAEGLCGHKKISDQLNFSVELAKAKWVYVQAGVVTLGSVRAYFWEGPLHSSHTATRYYSTELCCLCFMCAGIIMYMLALSLELEISWDVLAGTGISVSGVLVCALWWNFRMTFLMLRRRATGLIFAVGNPSARSGARFASEKARFPILRDDMKKLVDAFLAMKGVSRQVGSTRSFVRSLRAWGSCRREKHTLELGRQHYIITKEPDDPLIKTGCLFRKECQSGFIADVMVSQRTDLFHCRSMHFPPVSVLNNRGR